MTDLTPTEVSEIRKSVDSAIENVKNIIDLLQKSEMEIISLRERAERAERERDEFAIEFAKYAEDEMWKEETGGSYLAPFDKLLEQFKQSRK